MDSCHYCCDTIEKLNNEYIDLYDETNKELNDTIKKFHYKYCLKYINLVRIDMEQNVKLAIESDPNVNEDREEEIEFWTFNLKTFMKQIEWFNSDGDWRWLDRMERKLQINR